MILLLLAILLFLLLTIAYTIWFIIRLIKFYKKRTFLFIPIILLLVAILSILNKTSIFIVFYIYFISFTILIDLLYLIFKKYLKKEYLIKIYKSFIIPASISLLLIVYGLFNIKNIVETTYTIKTNKINEDIKILLLADSHYGEVLKKTELDKIKLELDKVNADIVILAGDMVDESTSKIDMEYLFKTLGKINNKDGIYYIYGNHDQQLYQKNKNYTTKELNDALTKSNIKILKDETYTLDNNITLVGRDNVSNYRASMKELLKNVNKDDFIITLDHQPIKYKENVKNGVDLILSGHTHAGQIFPIEWIIKLFNTADNSYGLKQEDNTSGITTSGLVGWGFPLRTSRNSEYVVITIKGQ